jgi:hypothetical protein
MPKKRLTAESVAKLKPLMSRAGVRPDIAERVLGHAIKGVEGVYDRYSYEDEKSDALNRLAALVESIVNPPSDNVVNMRPRRRTRAGTSVADRPR